MSSLTQLFTYPIKSTAGISLSESLLTALGLEYDRHWMLVDENNKFITQRKYSQMALIKPEFEKNSLSIVAPGMETLSVPLTTQNESPEKVIVWKDVCDGFNCGEDINQWFSEYLKVNVKLVAYDRNQPRATDPLYSKTDDVVSFADGFPLLITSTSSLNDLNSRLQTPVTMTHFRPNLVVDFPAAFAEDNWKRIRIGDLEFDAVKPCSRCILTTVDPLTGVRRQDGEPLKTLTNYRKQSSGVIFGMNLIPRSRGTLKVGDDFEVLE